MEFELAGFEYSVSKMDAFKQFHVARKLAPVLAELAPNGEAPDMTADSSVIGLANAVAKLNDVDSEYVIHAALACITRKQASGLGFAKVTNGSSLMFADIDMQAMLHLTWKALQFNFQDFFNALPSDLKGATQKAKSK